VDLKILIWALLALIYVLMLTALVVGIWIQNNRKSSNGDVLPTYRDRLEYKGWRKSPPINKQTFRSYSKSWQTGGKNKD